MEVEISMKNSHRSLWLGIALSIAAAALLAATPRSEGADQVAAMDMAAMKSQYERPKSIPFPPENPYTPAKAHLGKMLFFDPRLSGSNALACASCHSPNFTWGDGLPLAVGHGHKVLGRRSPTILNAAFGSIFFWDGRAGSLEEQALGPIKSTGEMNMPLADLVDKIRAIPGYKPLFDAAFPPDGAINEENIAYAIATYERTVVSSPAPFDEWIAGDESAISDGAKNGFVLFNTKAKCAECHSGWNFTDDSFHDIGLPSEDPGRAQVLPDVEGMEHAFKTPNLRNIAGRGPYMHDGSLPDLAAVVEHYNTAGVDRPSRSDVIVPLGLTESEKEDLVEFMNTLSSEGDPVIAPRLPR
jgi:cytochrome c peroxidase